MEFETLSTPTQPLILVPDLEATEIKRGAAAKAPGPTPLSDRFSAGGPIAAPILRKDAAGDPALLSFLISQERTHRFHRVQLACTFDPADGEPFAEATVQCVMRRVDGGAEVPTAWSMAPQRLESLSTWKLTWNLKTDVKFAEAAVGGEKTIGTPKPVIRAYNLLQSDPYWRLTDRPNERLYGSLELGMIVRSPRDVRVEIVAKVSASIYRNKFGLVLYKTPLQPLTLPVVPID